jgi:hypothetical protein
LRRIVKAYAWAVKVVDHAARHPVAPRVDHDGVTLGRSAGLLTALTASGGVRRASPSPWQDIDAIVVFDLAAGSR